MADVTFKYELNGHSVSYTWDPEEYMGPDVLVDGNLTNYDEFHIAVGLPGSDPFELLSEVDAAAQRSLPKSRREY